MIIEIELPDNEILLSDEELWNYVMTGIRCAEGWHRKRAGCDHCIKMCKCTKNSNGY